VAPATRNTIAKHINGIIDSPLMMALSAAKGNKTPILFVPSMHDDLFNDSVTKSLIEKIQDDYSRVLVEESIEGRRKQPSAENIVAETSNFVNSFRKNRKKIVVTLGATKQNIDSVRSIINYSTGRTGWDLCEYFHRMGHNVICLIGNTTTSPSFTLKDVRIKEKPDEMLSLCLNIAKNEKPDVWIHSAAVLDYVPISIEGKKSSGEKTWNIQLVESKKHLKELIPYTENTIRIGFKLETDDSEINLIKKSRNILDKYSLTAVVANLINETNQNKGKRCRLIFPDGRIEDIESNLMLAVAIERIISTFS
jgi:phosphopantothenoylcysteine decarboxylase/phosphopantothenate--cysteine ligase